MTIIFVTRPSRLARWQTHSVIHDLKQHFPSLEVQEKTILTKGDRIKKKPLPEIGGKGLFTEELEKELLQGRAQAAVHSLKDLPLDDTPGLVLAAILPRTDARDVFVSRSGYTLETLPPSAVIGTSSLRRSAQLLAVRPDLLPRPLRGNIDTRLRKALNGEYDAIIVAGAGLIRLGLQSYITEWLPFEWMLPAPGQGALAVQCAAADQETRNRLQVLNDRSTQAAVLAERAFLKALGGGCSLPIGAYAKTEQDTNGEMRIILQGVVVGWDGKRVIRVSGEGKDSIQLGEGLAQEALYQGAAELLASKTGESAD